MELCEAYTKLLKARKPEPLQFIGTEYDRAYILNNIDFNGNQIVRDPFTWRDVFFDKSKELPKSPWYVETVEFIIAITISAIITGCAFYIPYKVIMFLYKLLGG